MGRRESAIFICCSQNAGQNDSVKGAGKSSENVATFMFLETTRSNKIFIKE